MREWYVEQEGNTFLIRSPLKDVDVISDAMVTVKLGESFRDIPYEKLKDGQIFEEDDRGVVREMSLKEVLDDLDRVLRS